MNTEEFILAAQKNPAHKHRGYTYLNTVYENGKTSLLVTCPHHGDFSVKPKNHLKTSGCHKCSLNADVTTSEFIDIIHRNNTFKTCNYGYDKTIYLAKHLEVIVTCPTHGDFSVTPLAHLKGRGCRKCIQNPATLEDFILMSSEVPDHHGKQYSYEKTVYVHYKTDVVITCSQHGDFYVTPQDHLIGSGCPDCSPDSQTLLKFVSLAQEQPAHASRDYSYAKTVYNRGKSPVIVTCPVHQDFLVTPNDHLKGSGCKKCTGPGFSQETLSTLSSIDLDGLYTKTFTVQELNSLNQYITDTDFIFTDHAIHRFFIRYLNHSFLNNEHNKIHFLIEFLQNSSKELQVAYINFYLNNKGKIASFSKNTKRSYAYRDSKEERKETLKVRAGIFVFVIDFNENVVITSEINTFDHALSSTVNKLKDLDADLISLLKDHYSLTQISFLDVQFD